MKICTECFQIFKALGERKDYTESRRVRNLIRKTARGAHSAILLLQLGQVIISHCCNLDYIPNGIKWELFYETMLSVFYPFGTCPLKYNDYLRIMKPKMTKTKVGRGDLLLLVSSTYRITETHLKQFTYRLLETWSLFLCIWGTITLKTTFFSAAECLSPKSMNRRFHLQFFLVYY